MPVSIHKRRIIRNPALQWLAFLASLAAVWGFVFVLALLARRIPPVKSLAEYIDESGIEASALYYSGVEETATSEMYLHNAKIYKPDPGKQTSR